MPLARTFVAGFVVFLVLAFLWLSFASFLVIGAYLAYKEILKFLT